MSQIYFRNGDRTVMTGYDRPLNYCHLTVFDADGESAYAHLDSFDALTWDSARVVAELDRLGIPYPTDLPDRLREHEARRAGNEVFRYPPGD
jgi:hypothetical protein